MVKYPFGAKSRERLETCHKDIQLIFNEASDVIDISILEGVRDTERQQKLFAEGKSQLDGVTKKSKHQPDEDGLSKAIDAMMYYKGFNPFTSENGIKSFYYISGVIMGIASKLLAEGKISHRLRWGGNWDSDMDFFQDSNFFDLPHFELVSI